MFGDLSCTSCFGCSELSEGGGLTKHELGRCFAKIKKLQLFREAPDPTLAQQLLDDEAELEADAAAEGAADAGVAASASNAERRALIEQKRAAVTKKVSRREEGMTGVDLSTYMVPTPSLVFFSTLTHSPAHSHPWCCIRSRSGPMGQFVETACAGH